MDFNYISIYYKESLRHKCLRHKLILIVILCITLIYIENVILMKMYTHWAPLAHSFPCVFKNIFRTRDRCADRGPSCAVSRAIEETTTVIALYIHFAYCIY